MKKTILILLSLFTLALTGNSYATLSSKRPLSGGLIFDYASVIKNKNSLNAHLRTLHKFADIEMVVVILSDLEGDDIDGLTSRLMSDWQIGRNTSGLKGILFLLALKEKLVRFEIGYDLEAIYPDAFVGYIEQDQMVPFFELGRVSDGISATLEMIIARAYEKIEEKAYFVREGQRAGGEKQYSGGAGAKRWVDIGSVKVPEIIPYSGDIKSYFSPQPTPALAFLRDIEKNRRHIRGYDFDLYTDETRRISKNWVFTKAQMDNEVRDTRGKSFRVFIKGDRGIAVFAPEHRQAAPFFLRRYDRGWQLDIASMSRLIHFDMRNRFHMTLFRNPYLELFRKAYTFGVNGFMYYKDEPPPYIGVNVWDGNTRKAKIRSMVKDGPADRAGLKQGDVIIHIGDIEVKTTGDVVRAMRKYQIGDIVKVKVKQGLIPRTVMLTLEAFDPYAEEGT
jgi:uncharacterized membrane protein YgcG